MLRKPNLRQEMSLMEKTLDAIITPTRSRVEWKFNSNEKFTIRHLGESSTDW